MKDLQMQLELPLNLEPPEDNPIARMEYTIGCVRESFGRVRKSLYVRHNELQKRYAELEERLRILEKHLCRPQW